MIINKADEMENTDKLIVRQGTIKIRIEIGEMVESLWCYLYPEYMKLYSDPDYEGDVFGILLNTSVTSDLRYGDEVKLKCFKDAKPLLDKEWYEQHK